MFNFKGLPHCFPEWLYQLAFPTQLQGIPLSPHPLQHVLFLALSIFAILTGVSFHVSVSYSYVFLGEVSVLLICPFIDWIVYFLGVEFGKYFIDLGS